MKQQEQKLTSVRPVVRHNIPISLSVISYFFFAVGLLAALRGFCALIVAKTDLPLSPLVSLIFGVLYLFLSRGLRRCSCGWHVCALILVSCSLILMVYRSAHYLFSPAFHSTRAFPYGFLIALVLGLLLQV
jgi:hypothetical protein